VTVMFPELGEEVIIRIPKLHTFDQLLDDACRYFGRPSHRPRMELVNDEGVPWSQQLSVRGQMIEVCPPTTAHSSLPCTGSVLNHRCTKRWRTLRAGSS
jgi:hypothetical protein